MENQGTNQTTDNKPSMDELLEEGKKHLAELQEQFSKLADTAQKAAGIAADQGSQKADELIKQASVHIDNAKTLIEEKTKEAMASEQYKNLEAEGKKAIDDAQVKINEIAEKLSGLFGGKK